jgi:hypothetical protein
MSRAIERRFEKEKPEQLDEWLEQVVTVATLDEESMDWRVLVPTDTRTQGYLTETRSHGVYQPPCLGASVRAFIYYRHIEWPWSIM